jgi:PadR family transcriptional regulator AphA
MTRVPGNHVSLADHACLSIVGEARTHGWAIVKLLAPDGEIGRVWSLSRALTYRSIDRLADDRLIDRADAGRRAELTITRAGRRLRRAWLLEPVDHLRDLRTEFLLKLTLCRRAGIDTTTLIAAQRERLAPAIAALTDHRPTDAVELWRYESARAAEQFLERVTGA